MKQMIWIAIALGIATQAEAQTNRTYYSNMQTQQIYENEQKGGTVTDGKVKLSLGTETVQQEENYLRMNAVQPYQGYGQNNEQNETRLEKNNRKWNEVTRDDLPYRSDPYDTTKNNGHCIGCGSGTMTDPHRWR